jgi:hypothetical protein
VSWDRPLLLVDVDGVLSLFGFDASAPPPGRPALIDGIPHLLSTEAAACLRAVAPLYEPVWCTGWEERAGEHLPYLLDLPRGWPFVPLRAARGPGWGVAGHWKLAAIDAFAGRERPLAWVDDDLDSACREWAAARPGRTLLVPTDPGTGLTQAGAAELANWPPTLPAPQGTPCP